MSAQHARRLRCAVYTRKSTEEGLDMEFNSLDAQREACEAFIASQRSEGWVCMRDRYDDGGFSGGSTDRPALQQLLADIKAGRIDVIVVYKVDRLTRSLADFAKLVELFDKHGLDWRRYAWCCHDEWSRLVEDETAPVETIQTQPVTLKATNYNCYQNPMLKRETCGGDFETTIARSQFGMSYGLNYGLPDSIRLTVAHPTRSGLDQELLVRGRSGVYEATLVPLSTGRWLFVIQDEARSWRMDGSAYLPAEMEIRMDPNV